MLKNLKRKVRRANKSLVRLELVNSLTTFGNVSAISKGREYIAIKPSGVNYDEMQDSDIVLLDLEGNIIEGDKHPSSDTLTHLELYRRFPEIRAVIHTHSLYATTFAQAKIPILCFGTTHADYFNGTIPLTRDLSEEEINHDYELNTGRVIAETFEKNGTNPLEVSACLVSSHGPFVWGGNLDQALERAMMLEQISRMNFMALRLNPDLACLDKKLLEKHFSRKHGPNAYYGQK